MKGMTLRPLLREAGVRKMADIVRQLKGKQMVSVNNWNYRNLKRKEKEAEKERKKLFEAIEAWDGKDRKRKSHILRIIMGLKNPDTKHDAETKLAWKRGEAWTEVDVIAILKKAGCHRRATVLFLIEEHRKAQQKNPGMIGVLFQRSEFLRANVPGIGKKIAEKIAEVAANY